MNSTSIMTAANAAASAIDTDAAMSMNKSRIDALADAALKRESVSPPSKATLSPSLLAVAATAEKLLPSVSDTSLLSSLRGTSAPGIGMAPQAHGGANAAYLATLLDEQRRRASISMTAPQAQAPMSQVQVPSASAADYASLMNSQYDATVTAPSRRRKPNFAEKLHSVLHDRECRNAISWLPSGRSFCITDQDDFVKRILPKYFREAKFESFSRRLKRWGFRKVYTTGLAQIIFSHDLFHRDRPDLCRIMNGRDKVAADECKHGAVDASAAAMAAPPQAPFAPPEQQLRMSMMFQQQQQLQQQMAMRQRAAMLGMPSMAPPVNTFTHGPSLASLPSTGSQASVHSALSADSLDAAAIMKEAQAIVARSLPSAAAGPSPPATSLVNPDDPGALHLAQAQLTRLNDDIANCEEQLAILQRLKELKERRRALEGGSGSPRGVSPASGL